MAIATATYVINDNDDDSDGCPDNSDAFPTDPTKH